MVGLQVLVLAIGVRIPASEQKQYHFRCCFFSIYHIGEYFIQYTYMTKLDFLLFL